jgi:MATE family multidrug resistance protein
VATAARSAAGRELRRLALPLIATNISVPLLGLVDTAVAGHLPGEQYLAAVGLGSSFTSALFFVFGFLRMGTTGLVAQAQGAGDRRAAELHLTRALIVAFALGLVLLFAIPLLLPLAGAIYAPQPAVASELSGYLAFRLAGAPASFAISAIYGWLLGRGEARTSLVLLVSTNALNALLDVAFVFGLGMTAPGIGLATTLAECCGAAGALVIVRRRTGRLLQTLRAPDLRDGAAFRRLFAVNRDLFLRSATLEAVFVLFTLTGARLGSLEAAVNAVLFNFFTLTSYGLDGFAFAVETLVGRAIGARDPKALAEAERTAFVHAGGLAAVAGLTWWLAGGMIIDLLTDLPLVRAAARDTLWAAAAIPPIAVWAFIYDGIFIGATRARELRDGMVLAALVFLTLLLLVPLFGYAGLWLALLGFLAARGLILHRWHDRAIALAAQPAVERHSEQAEERPVAAPLDTDSQLRRSPGR